MGNTTGQVQKTSQIQIQSSCLIPRGQLQKAGLAKVSSGLLPEDTVLMSSRAPIGYLALIKNPSCNKSRIHCYSSEEQYVSKLHVILDSLQYAFD